MPKNPLLQLKPAAVKEKKRNKKKSPVSPLKKIQSPLKNKLLNSPAKTLPGACGSPQKFIDGFLKYEGPASEKPLVKFFSIFSTLTFYQIDHLCLGVSVCEWASFPEREWKWTEESVWFPGDAEQRQLGDIARPHPCSFICTMLTQLQLWVLDTRPSESLRKGHRPLTHYEPTAGHAFLMEIIPLFPMLQFPDNF